MPTASTGCANDSRAPFMRSAPTRPTESRIHRQGARQTPGRSWWRLAFAPDHRREPAATRSPGFTILTDAQKNQLKLFFRDWGSLLMPALVPGAHVCVAGHPMLQPLVQVAMAEAGFEIRPALMRLYFSFRGRRPPQEWRTGIPEVCVTPKGAYEPWMLFRKPISERTVADNLRRWKTGGLRRLSWTARCPMPSPAGRTPDREAAISDHPCLKPQHFMRILVRALLPLGEGVLLDTFMGSGSTIAAADASATPIPRHRD